MAKDQLQGPSSESLEAGYETTTVSVKGLAWMVVCLVVLAVVVHVGIWALLKGYWYADVRTDRLVSALQAVPQPPPPGPRIQPNPFDSTEPDRPSNLPPDDLQAMYRGEDEAFRQMGWTVDERSHVLTIPARFIEQVIQEEAGRKDEPPPPASQPTTTSGEISPRQGGNGGQETPGGGSSR